MLIFFIFDWMKRVPWQVRSKLHLQLLAFENINMFAKGNYRIKVESFFQQTRCSIEAADKQNRSSELGKRDNDQYFTKEFVVRFQNQKVDLNELLIIDSPALRPTKDAKLILKLTLLKAETAKNEGPVTQYVPLRSSFWIIRFLMNSFCEYAECTFSQPFLANLSVLMLYQPVSMGIDTKQLKLNEEELLGVRKEVKKMRYNNYLLYNKFKKIFYSPFSVDFTLPRLFVTSNKTMEEVKTDEQHLLNYLLLYETSGLTLQQMNAELVSISAKNEALLKIFKENCDKSTIYLNKLRMEYEEKQTKRYKQYVSREQYKPKYYEEYKPLLKEKLKALNRQLQAGLQDETINNLLLKVENVYEQAKPTDLPVFPVIIHETQRLSLPPPEQQTLDRPKTRYILILAHGYQGCPEDLTMIANGFKRRYKKSKYLILKSYKNKMSESIEAMSDCATEEINTYLECLDFKEKHYRIVMIGHSMGGLILRLAANKIKQKQYLWAYISLGSPHLGYLQGIKLLIRAGLSLFSNIYSIPCLNELSCKDSSDLHDALIYRLSMAGQLSNFKRVVVVASSRDKYVSWHSARIENFNKDVLKQYTFIENEMICNILGKGSGIERIDRLEVDFKISQSNMDKIIGRTSHIKMLTDLTFIELLCNSCLPLIFED